MAATRKNKEGVWVYSLQSIFHYSKHVYHNKENLERYKPNKNGRGTERHLPKTGRLAFLGPQVSVVIHGNETKNI